MNVLSSHFRFTLLVSCLRPRRRSDRHVRIEHAQLHHATRAANKEMYDGLCAIQSAPAITPTFVCHIGAILGMPLGIVAVTVGVFAIEALVEMYAPSSPSSSTAMSTTTITTTSLSTTPMSTTAPGNTMSSRIVTTCAYGSVLLMLFVGLFAFLFRVYRLAELGSHTTCVHINMSSWFENSH
jgi:hypothetical protein